jgi:type IV pilus assembly protein PilY1
MSAQFQPKTNLPEIAIQPADVNRTLIKAKTMKQSSADLTRRTSGTSALRLGGVGFTGIGLAIAIVLMAAAPLPSRATQLDLANTPLFLSGTVQPNIFFLADDSGSMDWNTVTSESDGAMALTGGSATTTYHYIFPQACNKYSATNTNGRILPSEAAVSSMTPTPTNKHGVWRGRFSGYNTLYYNPDVTYLPWTGLDDAGVAFANSNPTAARLDPYVSAANLGCTGTPLNKVDLTAVMSWTADNVPNKGTGTTDVAVSNYYPAMYYTWTDSNSNGVVDASDAHTLVEIRSTTPTYTHKAGTRPECGAGTTCTYAQEIQNFANWFTYYRRRILTSKNAIGRVVARSSARVGFGTLHDNGTVNTQISPMNPSVSSGNKKTLMDAIYKNYANSDTPLRTKLDEVGKYYECVSGNIFGNAAGTNCPIVSAANGGACQKNFTVLTTDGYYNDSFTFSASPNNRDGDGNTAFDGGAYADTWNDTLADIAMNYYERDLSALPDNVSPAGTDTATHQHMNTFTVAFGVNGTLTANPPNPTSAFSWPDPSLSDANKIDDLRHAAYNGRGKFLSAKNPTELSTSMSSALGAIDDLTSSAAAVAVNSHTLTTDTTIYQARFNSKYWSGDLRALPISTSGVIGTTELWKAGDQLKSQNWNTGRKIITHNGTTGVAFRWASLSTNQQDSLNDDPATVAIDNDGLGSNRLNWLRGDATNEATGSNFRERTDAGGSHFVLGDLINSAPVYVGAPGVLPDSLESVAHSTFGTTMATRTRVIYVGSNDGMMHGFDAATGNEVLAYVPSTLYPDLSKLTDPAYVHRYYADGSPTTGDVFGTYSGCTASPCWRTVLVSGLAGGGKGVFALDVTNPSTFSESNANKIALWEISAAADNDLGYTYSQPTITKVQTGAATYKWVAIFGNGYNSVNESAALYIVDMENGSLIKKIVADVGSGTSGNGLSTPVVWDENGDYIADYVYAGDLKGNLWKFDLNTGSSATWKVSYGTAGTPRPLFRAVDSTGVSQPITERPAVSSHPVSGITGSMVYFGTGSFITNGDRSPPLNPTHTFYGIWDKGVASTAVPVARSDLLPQTISAASASTRTITSTAITWRVSGSTACAADGSGECLGWRVDLPLAGEMSVTNPVLLTASMVNMPRIIFTTLVPGADVCSAGGTGWLMELDPINGGLLSAPYLDTNGDGVINGSDSVISGLDLGIGVISEPVVIYDPARGLIDKVFSGSTGAVKAVEQTGLVNPPAPAEGRRSWRQLR